MSGGELYRHVGKQGVITVDEKKVVKGEHEILIRTELMDDAT